MSFRRRTDHHHATLSDYRLSVRRKKVAADADDAATEFIAFEGNGAPVSGEMSKMVPERPDAGAVRYYDRRGGVGHPGGRVFFLIAAHGITPIDLAGGLLEISA